MKPGAEARCGPAHNARILALLDQKPPPGYSNWTGPLLSKAHGDNHIQQVWRFLRARKIDLSSRKSWCRSNDPDFMAKAAEIAGLCLVSPENAVVCSLDEKPALAAATGTAWGDLNCMESRVWRSAMRRPGKGWFPKI